MPTNIVRFERLAYLSLALSLVYNFLDRDLALGALVLMGVLFGPISILLIWLTARCRKNWARWVFSILGAMGIAADAWGTFTSAAFLGEDIIMICSDIVLAASLYYIWSGGSGDWFRGHAATSQGGLEPASIEGC